VLGVKGHGLDGSAVRRFHEDGVMRGGRAIEAVDAEPIHPG